MLYLVEIDFSDPAREAEWNAWYDERVVELLHLPGFVSAQRFRNLMTYGFRYVAAYEVTSPAALSSTEYKATSGPGVASARFSDAIRRRRNLFDGIGHVREVSPSERMIFADDSDASHQLGVNFIKLTSVGIDRQPATWLLAIVYAETARALPHRNLSAYEPLTRRFTASVGVL